FMVLYKTTILYPIGATFNLDNRKQQWKRVLYKFDKLAEIPNIKGPKFIFVHMLTPHDPYVFDRNGNFLTRWEESKRSIKVNYIDQLIFINKKMRILIDKIFERSDTPPIIIVQADEGPYPQKFRLKGKNFNWKRASKDELGIKMRIMNAYFLPNVDINVLYPSITPVNSFRLIFNLYFNTHFELLPDESYAHVDDTHIYDFFNVSDKVKYDWKEKEKLDLPGFSK
ncbi:MAG: hypothetical protein SVO01_12640, partial [Thermotogota bacterium]|nr:hypothetical protein [Thermotogota bacterium]